jgi:UrcA family protein
METYDTVPSRHARRIRGRSVFTFSVLALALPFTSWLANAEALESQVRTVSYEYRDVTTPNGADQLYRRLQAAAHQVCADYDPRGFSTARAHKVCYEGALNAAVAKVDAPLLTQRHAASDSLVQATRVTTVASR